jgi:hypothetical protein
MVSRRYEIREKLTANWCRPFITFFLTLMYATVDSVKFSNGLLHFWTKNDLKVDVIFLSWIENQTGQTVTIWKVKEFLFEIIVSESCIRGQIFFA